MFAMYDMYIIGLESGYIQLNNIISMANSKISLFDLSTSSVLPLFCFSKMKTYIIFADLFSR